MSDQRADEKLRLARIAANKEKQQLSKALLEKERYKQWLKALCERFGWPLSTLVAVKKHYEHTQAVEAEAIDLSTADVLRYMGEGGGGGAPAPFEPLGDAALGVGFEEYAGGVSVLERHGPPEGRLALLFHNYAREHEATVAAGGEAAGGGGGMVTREDLWRLLLAFVVPPGVAEERAAAAAAAAARAAELAAEEAKRAQRVKVDDDGPGGAGRLTTVGRPRSPTRGAGGGGSAGAQAGANAAAALPAPQSARSKAYFAKLLPFLKGAFHRKGLDWNGYLSLGDCLSVLREHPTALACVQLDAGLFAKEARRMDMLDEAAAAQIR
jgi:hypothetical protein